MVAPVVGETEEGDAPGDAAPLDGLLTPVSDNFTTADKNWNC